jgi:hypothetical protein
VRHSIPSSAWRADGRLNGRQVTSFQGDRGLSGYIGLQNHDDGSNVQYRDVWVFDESAQP